MRSTGINNRVWSAKRKELYEAVSAVWRHTSNDTEFRLREKLVEALSENPGRNVPVNLDDDQLDLLLSILNRECDREINGQTYPYHPLNNVRKEIKEYKEGNG